MEHFIYGKAVILRKHLVEDRPEYMWVHMLSQPHLPPWHLLNRPPFLLLPLHLVVPQGHPPTPPQYHLQCLHPLDHLLGPVFDLHHDQHYNQPLDPRIGLPANHQQIPVGSHLLLRLSQPLDPRVNLHHFLPLYLLLRLLRSRRANQACLQAARPVHYPVLNQLGSRLLNR